MVKREKRLEKGVLSLQKQKRIHEIKKEQAKKLGQEELVRYYTKEIASFENRIKDRKGKIKRI